MTSKTILPPIDEPNQIKFISPLVDNLWTFTDDLDEDLHRLRLSLGRYEMGQDAVIDLVRDINLNLNRLIDNVNEVKESLPDED